MLKCYLILLFEDKKIKKYIGLKRQNHGCLKKKMLENKKSFVKLKNSSTWNLYLYKCVQRTTLFINCGIRQIKHRLVYFVPE